MTIPVNSGAQSIAVNNMVLQFTATFADGATSEMQIPICNTMRQNNGIQLTLEDLKGVDVEYFFRYRLPKLGPRLKEAGIFIIDDLLRRTPSQIRDGVGRIGESTIEMLQGLLAQYDLTLTDESDRNIVFDTDLSKLQITKDTVRKLYDAGVKSVRDLTEYTEAQILSIKGLGQKRLSDIKKALANERLSLKDNDGYSSKDSFPGTPRPSTRRSKGSFPDTSCPPKRWPTDSAFITRIQPDGKHRAAVQLNNYRDWKVNPTSFFIDFRRLRSSAAGDCFVFHRQNGSHKIRTYKSIIPLEDALREYGQPGVAYEALRILKKTDEVAYCEKLLFQCVGHEENPTAVITVPLYDPSENYYEIILTPPSQQ